MLMIEHVRTCHGSSTGLVSCTREQLTSSASHPLCCSPLDGVQVVFLFADTQIVQEGFVEDISNLLNTYEVPNLMQVRKCPT